MKRSEIRVLVVDDDVTQGRAIQEALKRIGYEARWVGNPDDALNLARQSDFKLAIVDCLLPRTNGVELSVQLKTLVGEELKIILTSGIYKDKSFAKEAIQKTRALDFVLKPFDLEKLISQVDTSFSDVLDPDLTPLMSTLTVRELSQQNRLEALNQSGSLHGFELPLVYSLIFGSPLSGELQVTTTDGDVSKLIFHHGKLTQVLLKDSTSYFGVLLVEMGFTSVEEVDEALIHQGNSPIGERLVAAHSLSPHAIEVVREEQMLIRLSKTVQDTFIEVSFKNLETSASDVALQRERFTQLSWDWICSKISMEWLKSYYQPWLDFSVVFEDAALIQRRLATLAGLNSQFGVILKAVSQAPSLGEALEANANLEDQLLPILHLMALEKLLHFGSRRISKADVQRRTARIQKLLEEAKHRDHFQILGVSPRAGDREINRQYMELAKAFHPDRLGPDTPPELLRLTEQYFARITQAHEVLKDPTKRVDYAREIRDGSAEKVLQNESLFEQGQGHLRKGKYQLALDIFAKLATQRGHRSDLFIYLAWAKIKVGASEQKVEKFLTSLNEMISKVPPEDRHSAPYFYTKGLFNMQVGDLEKAKNNFKHALILDSNFVEARRDLAVARNRLRTEAGTDLSTVVHRFLGRKKR